MSLRKKKIFSVAPILFCMFVNYVYDDLIMWGMKLLFGFSPV